VDGFIFVSPRRIRIGDPAQQLATLSRPLRAMTMRGPRVALATSELIPEAASFKVEIGTLDPKLDDIVRQCLAYGALKGLGQWRNAGFGRFSFQEVKPEPVAT
jgi:hypothetical protein